MKQQPNYQKNMHNDVEKRASRKIAARQDQRSIWYGLGMFGLVGWSVAVPTLIGIFTGLWMDRRFDHPFSCTLMGMFIGLVAGCWVAWYWMKREGLLSDPGEDEDADDPKTDERESLK